VVLSLFGLVVLALTAGLRFGMRGWSAQEAHMARYAETEPVQHLLRQLIAEGRDFGGRADRLDFRAALPEVLGIKGLSEISLAIGEEGRLVLSWKRREGEQGAVDLLKRAGRLDLAYAASASDGEVRWQDAVDPANPPRLIRMRLIFPPGDRRHWPDLVVAPRLSLPQIKGGQAQR